MENKLSIGLITALCAVPCAIITVFAANAALACGLLVCWIICSLLIWIGEAAGKALSKKTGKKLGMGVWVICALLLAAVIIQICRDLSIPKPPEDMKINLWGLGSFLLSLMILPPVFSAAILNAASLIKQKQPAINENISNSGKAMKIIVKFILGLAGYAAALLLLMLF